MVQATKQQMVDFLYQFLPYTKKQLNSLSQEKLMEAIKKIEVKVDDDKIFSEFVKHYEAWKMLNKGFRY